LDLWFIFTSPTSLTIHLLSAAHLAARSQIADTQPGEAGIELQIEDLRLMICGIASLCFLIKSAVFLKSSIINLKPSIFTQV